MKIGFDALAANNRSGSGLYTKQLLLALSGLDRENEYFVFSSTRPQALGMQDTPPNFRFVKTRFFSNAFKPIWTQTLLPVHCRRYGLDLLHVPQFVAPVWGSVPLVVTIHDVAYRVFPETIARSRLMLYNRIVPRVAARARAIIADSEGAQRDVSRILGIASERIRVIPLGVGEDFFNPISKGDVDFVKRKFALQRDYILAVGTLEPRKNLETLIGAFDVLCRKGCEVELAIVGRPGWKYGSVLKLANSPTMDNRVKFLGFVSRSDLPALYQGASAFAFPSLYEGFGLPILEAMASGAPIVASGIAVALELLKREGTGLTVEPHDVQAWADALEDIVTDTELASFMGANAREEARNYTWERTAQQTLELYGDLVGSNNC